MLTNISLTVYPQKIYSNENKLNHSSLKVYMTLQNFFNVKIICSLVPCTSFQYYSRTLLFLLLLCKINIVQINYEKHCYLFPEKKWNNRVPKDLVLVKWQFKSFGGNKEYTRWELEGWNPINQFKPFTF